MADLIPTNIVDIAIYVLLFSAYFMVAEVLFFSVARRTSDRDKMTERLAGSQQHSHGQQPLRPSLVMDRRRIWGPPALARLVEQAGYKWRLWHSLVVPMLPFVVFAGMVYFATGLTVPSLVAGVVGSASVPFLVLLIMRSSRRRKFESQLPDVLETMVRSIRAGHPVPTSIGMVVQEFRGPIGEEFRQVSDEMTYGLDLETAMRNLSMRVRLHDVSLVVSAISIQTKSGGNLSEILGNLAGVIRERSRMRLKVRALSSEGRMSAIMLSSLPIILYFVLSFTAPSFYGDVWKYNIVYPIFIASGVWMAIGNLIMWRLVNFEI